MPNDCLTQWLHALGYTAEAEALHLAGNMVSGRHPYALEMHALLRPDGPIQAEAVFDVEGVPTVVFVGERYGNPLTAQQLDGIRQRLWNQNLVSVVIAIAGHRAEAMPVRRLANAHATLKLRQARPDGDFSAADVRSSAVVQRFPRWFEAKARVDQALLDNLSRAVDRIQDAGMGRMSAQVLMGQVLFVSYLEHRSIVSDHYRSKRKVGTLHDLIASGDRDGVIALIDRLRLDFNGDFLSRTLATDAHSSPENDSLLPWYELPNDGFEILARFLDRVDLESDQTSFWNYDFSFIPVELLSGLYESFLNPDTRAREGAYYTPRHLATLVVDQAFAASPDPLAERIFDGACGSGILLTTAYRKLIALAQERQGQPLGFQARCDLLLRQIFGGDVNPMACRVTAFSLYLSLLEGLDPTDVLAAQEREGGRLPSLRGSNLCSGGSADIFSDEHPFFGQRFSLILSNPPWAEASGASTSADSWAQAQQVPVVLRQLAGMYSQRALDFLAPGGRVCLILPITLFLGAMSQRFVAGLFARLRPRRLINFGDLQGLLFPTAENTCHVLLAERRANGESSRVPFTETFDYCVPKAELSLAFNRLSLQSADRHEVQTQAIMDDTQRLVALMWGDAYDLGLLTRLSMHGTFGSLWHGKQARWISRKGVHMKDRHRVAVSAEPLRTMPFVTIDILKRGVPVLHSSLLEPWPADRDTVVGLNDKLLAVFEGPRVLFPDGFAREELNARAVFVDGLGSFSSSVGVIAGPREDEALLRFVAVYLRSRLARYFLMLTCAKMLSERNALHLADIEPFPFFAPEAAPSPTAAREALAFVAALTRQIEQLPADTQVTAYADSTELIESAVYDYFGLSALERERVDEAATVLLPSIRPRAYRSLYTARQRPATIAAVRRYAQVLAQTLADWRDRLGGTGHFHVEVLANDPRGLGGIAVVRVQALVDATASSDVMTRVDDALVQRTLQALRSEQLDAVSRAGLTWVLEQQLWTPRGLYLARPLVMRAWLVRTAMRDAEQIVRAVQLNLRPEVVAA